MTDPVLLPGSNPRCLIVCDHASNAVPAGIDLGLAAADLSAHIAWDLGSAALSRALAERLRCDALLASVSRLVVDCNRTPETAIPTTSDGRAIPGNADLPPQARAARLALHARYHDAIAGRLARLRPQLLIAVHSFTPCLQSKPAPRPWPIAVLWNKDTRAAQPALAELRADSAISGPIGANQPYSGQDLNYTMNRHGEGNGIPYLTFEVRQDELHTASGVDHYAGVLQRAVAAALAATAA